MGRWRYRLESEGKHLRELIDKEETKENLANIVLYLRVCCKRLMNKMNKEDICYSEVEDLYLILDGDDQIILSNENIEDYGVESRSEFVDSRLIQFYDLCDEVGCWLGV